MKVPSLIKPVYKAAEKKIKTYPCHSNRASEIGDVCERKLVYARTEWDKRPLHSVDLQLVFNEGVRHESAVLMDLEGAGISVICQQQSLFDQKHNISGHVDGQIVWPKKGRPRKRKNINGHLVPEPRNVAAPLEIKSMNPYDWQRVAKDGPREYEWWEVEMAFSRKPWLRRYYAQMQIYIHLLFTDLGVMLAKNRSTGAIAQINIPRDQLYIDGLLQKADRINEYVHKYDAAENGQKEAALPDKIAWEKDTCGMCDWQETICKPGRPGNPYEEIEDAAVAEWLNEMDMFAAGKQAYDAAKKKVTEWAKAMSWRRATIDGRIIEKKPHGKGDRIVISMRTDISEILENG